MEIIIYFIIKTFVLVIGIGSIVGIFIFFENLVKKGNAKRAEKYKLEG